MRNNFDFFEIHFDSLNCDNQFKIFNLNNIKFVFVNIEIQINLLKFFQHFVNMLHIFFFNIIVNENIIEIRYIKNIQIFSQHVINKNLKRDKNIA